jgi:hypothetical protein
MKKALILLPLVVTMSACSSFKHKTSVELEAPKMFGSSDNEVRYPDWYVKGPKSDDSGIYAVASEYSSDFQFSVDKSMLSAKRELAANFSSYISAMMKDFASESGDSVARADLDRTTKMIVSRINLIGVQRVNFKVVHERNGYRAFVKLRYSADESNRLLMAEIRKNQALYAKFKSSNAFKELDAEVQKVEDSKIEEIKLMNGIQ